MSHETWRLENNMMFAPYKNSGSAVWKTSPLIHYANALNFQAINSDMESASSAQSLTEQKSGIESFQRFCGEKKKTLPNPTNSIDYASVLVSLNL